MVVLVQEIVNFNFCTVSWLKCSFFQYIEGGKKPLENWVNDKEGWETIITCSSIALGGNNI